jgi:hypothetical protein
MKRMLKTMALGLLLAAALTVAIPTEAHAQVIVVQSPAVYSPPPIYRTYSAPTYVVPSIAYSAPVYTVPRVAYYPAPVVSYSAPVVSYAAPVTTYSSYAVPAVTTPAPGVYTTYTYWNGLGIFRPRYVNQTYYTPVLP